jgi:hypothetical protein
MKDLLLVMAFLGSLAMAHGQVRNANSTRKENHAAQEESDYLRKVQSPITPKAVTEYQVMAVHYDVAKSDLFDGRDALFLVVFRTQKGTIEAFYDWRGDMVESIERFRNLALPIEIMRTGLKDYSGWRVIGTNYYVYYVKDRRTRIIYTIQISNGIKKKKIHLDGEGALL